MTSFSYMRIHCMQMGKQAETILKARTTNCSNMEVLNPWRRPKKDKVVFIMGATGTGKSRLSIDLATRFSAEIINSDKIQVHKGLDIVTNKVTKEEQCGIPHHLLSTIQPNVDFTTREFCHMATHAVESILQKDKLPIIVGGSNTYIEFLVSDPLFGFKSKYECCFLWVDVSKDVLHDSVSRRVDQMVDSGFVQEVKEIFDPNNMDYTCGIRRAIGVPELDKYFRAEPFLDEPNRTRMLQVAIDEMKDNTCKLVNRQLEKIYRLRDLEGWDLNRLDATEVFRATSKDAADGVWNELVTKPSQKIVTHFLTSDYAHSTLCSQSTVPSHQTWRAATSI